MKQNWVAVIFLFALATTSCSQESYTPETADKAGPLTPDIASEQADNIKVVFQNEYVRVLRIDLEPNDELAPHDGHRRVIYSLNDYEMDWTTGNATSGHRSWKRGDTHDHDTEVHALKNPGETTASFLVFERLDSSPPSAPVHEDGTELPIGARSLLSNEDFHLLEVELQPGEQQALHHGGWRVIFALNDFTIEWHENDRIKQKSWSEGDIHWHKPAQHAVVNTGDTQARWLVVGLKN